MFTGSPAEGIQIIPEQKVAPLAEGDAQSPQHTLDTRPLTDAPAISCEAPEKVQERACCGAFAARRLSVALIKCQGSVYRGCANLLARAAGRPVLPGAEVPYVD